MTEIATIDWFGRWGTSVFSGNTAIFFDRIIINVAGNQKRHKSLVEFEFWPNQTTHFGVTCP